jgi:hypothetical protein
MKSTRWIYVLLILYFVVGICSIILFNGTGDPGDSIYHFLFAKYAPVHPELFFDHWAKPVFVLLSCPFAQFGFTGIKVFNLLVSLVTIFMTFRIACFLRLKNAFIGVLIMIFTPLFYILTFSGLTEPLFALFCALIIYLFLRQKYLAACLVLSFLPYVRSEGLIILGIFTLNLFVKKKWKFIPLLAFGSVVYSFAGYFVHHDLFWVFTKIPYAHASSQYGSGPLSHFVVQMLYVTGIPIYFLFWVGVISFVIKSIKKQISGEEQILIFLGFLVFFVAHSLFWYLGIFNSMGLKRVLICVMSMITIISLHGFNFITEVIPKKNARIVLQWFFILYIVIFPFTHNPAAVNWKRDMMKSVDQASADKTADFIRHKIIPDSRILTASPYVCMILGVDCFTSHHRLGIARQDIEVMRPGDILIWENWFAVVESGIRKDELDKNPYLLKLYDSTMNDEGREINYSVYQRK